MQWFLQDISIGENLKILRERFGYSQSELVAKLHLMGSNMSRSTYSKIETGTRNIRISDFLALKQIYGVDFSEFLLDCYQIVKNKKASRAIHQLTCLFAGYLSAMSYGVQKFRR